jgi:hypothetical protein
MSDTSILRDAGFDPRVKSYWTWKPVLGFTLGIITGFWPVMLAVAVTAVLMHLLMKRLT